MKNISQNKNYRLRLAIALYWLVFIYLFLPFGPDVITLLYKQLGFPFVKRSLAFFSLFGGLLVYLPFIRKFKHGRVLPYIITTIVLVVACAINISLKIPARTLHIPEYAILGIFLYSAFIVKYTSKRSYCLAIIIGIAAGVIDERIIQYLLPMRYYDFTDILLNIAGIITGIFLVAAYRMRSVAKISNIKNQISK